MQMESFNISVMKKVPEEDICCKLSLLYCQSMEMSQHSYSDRP